MNDVGEILFTERVSANKGVTKESMRAGHFDPWNTENGEGYLDELHERCQELSIPQRLQSAIHQIIDSQDPQRFCDLLLFLTATVPEFSRKDQERFATMDIIDVTDIDVIQLQQQHHLAPCIYEQRQILRHEEEQHALDIHGRPNEYSMVCWSDTSQGAGNERPGEGEDDETSDRTQLVVHSPSRQSERSHLNGPTHVAELYSSLSQRKTKGVTLLSYKELR